MCSLRFFQSLLYIALVGLLASCGEKPVAAPARRSTVKAPPAAAKPASCGTPHSRSSVLMKAASRQDTAVSRSGH